MQGVVCDDCKSELSMFHFLGMLITTEIKGVKHYKGYCKCKGIFYIPVKEFKKKYRKYLK